MGSSRTSVAWVFLTALAFPCFAGEGAEAFLSGLTGVEKLLDARDQEQAIEAQELLYATLDQHQDQDYARAELSWLYDLAAQCAFAVQYERPADLQEALGCAKKPKWKQRNGSFEVTFDRKAGRNVQASSGVLEHGAEFSFFPQGFTLFDDGVLYSDVSFIGKCQITIEGKLPPSGPGREHPPQLLLWVDDDVTYTVDFTWPTEYAPTVPYWTQGFIQSWNKGESTLLKTDINTGTRFKMMFGKKYDIQLVVKKDALAATATGKSMLSTSREPGAYGRLGLRWCPRVSEITLKGKVGDDLEEEVFARRRERREATFLAALEVSELLPPWLFLSGSEAAESDGK